MRVVEYPPQAETSTQPTKIPAEKAPAALIAVRLIQAVRSSPDRLVYIAPSEDLAVKIQSAIIDLDPALATVLLPAWDCLPYDRVPPSKQSMGRRMDALRVWSQPSSSGQLLLTSLEAAVQRVPPAATIANGFFDVAVGQKFGRTAFEEFARATGYLEEGIADEPGELVFRSDVIDIFPAGAMQPMRIVLSEDGRIAELKSYDARTQRTVSPVEAMRFGPASEAIEPNRPDQETSTRTDVSEQRLFQLYGDMISFFDLVGSSRILLAPACGERLASYLEFIDDARQAQLRYAGASPDRTRSLYLDQVEWDAAIKDHPSYELQAELAFALPSFRDSTNPRSMVLDFVKREMQANRKVALVGNGKTFDGLWRRLTGNGETGFAVAKSWHDIEQTDHALLFKIPGNIDRGFSLDRPEITLISALDVLGHAGAVAQDETTLIEPDLRIGDVLVHEDHGVALLKNLESVVIDDMICDAARLEYRDQASLLVPMQDFDKLWRYGSEPEAVSLDRLHTEAWSKKRISIEKDIRAVARHLLRFAEQRQNAEAMRFVAPRAAYAKFIQRFPYAETPDQALAIQAVLDDLSKGVVMNRLICGDVGFGKTEIALRASATVALAGGQVVLLAPTTVLARQHFSTFERRFFGTGVEVAMLSRVIGSDEAKQIKDRLAAGEIQIVVATQAILADDVRFANLGLLIVDEEHRFGTREKKAMRTMAPLLHLLSMSATPIPRTLQNAIVGIQDVSVLSTAPAKRRPVRTALTPVDHAAIRVAAMREYRRGGQIFFVVPQIADIEPVRQMLEDIVPELSLRVAHGRMKAAVIDEIIVNFSGGDGDVLLSTNIIESGLDVPRANTIFIWRADRFGLAQLHQLRGRVGRGKAQGHAFLLTCDDDCSDEQNPRLAALVENDRLGGGLSISMQDLDLRGGGDLVGDDQAGHVRAVGMRFYHDLLEKAVRAARRQKTAEVIAPVINLGLAGCLPNEYVSEAALRLTLYASIARTHTLSGMNELMAEFEDRFGDMPEPVLLLFRLAKLRIVAGSVGIAGMDAGPRGLAIRFCDHPPRKAVTWLTKSASAHVRDDRFIIAIPDDVASDAETGWLNFVEELLGKLNGVILDTATKSRRASVHGAATPTYPK